MKDHRQFGFVCVLVLLASSCARPPVPVASSSEKDLLVPAKVPIRLEKVLYEYNSGGNLMGDGCVVMVGIIQQASFDSFIAEHAAKEIEWHHGPFHIGEIGINDDDYVEWLAKWLEACKVTEDLRKVVDWKFLLRSGNPNRYYRIWYKQSEVDSFGKRNWKIECAELWLIDLKSRVFVHLLCNT